jgi:putative sigma-54 modulation protein
VFWRGLRRQNGANSGFTSLGELLVQINISTRHGHVSNETRQWICDKLQKLPRLFERLTAAEVIIDLAREDNRKVEIRLSAEHTDDFVATAESGDLLGLIDIAVHKLEQQLRKHKEKFIARRSGTHKQQEVVLKPQTPHG